MRFHVYLYERSPAIVSALREIGLEHGVSVDLTADQVISITEQFPILIHPEKDGVRLLCIDNPRWNFKQR